MSDDDIDGSDGLDGAPKSTPTPTTSTGRAPSPRRRFPSRLLIVRRPGLATARGSRQRGLRAPHGMGPHPRRGLGSRKTTKVVLAGWCAT